MVGGLELTPLEHAQIGEIPRRAVDDGPGPNPQEAPHEHLRLFLVLTLVAVAAVAVPLTAAAVVGGRPEQLVEVELLEALDGDAKSDETQSRPHPG